MMRLVRFDESETFADPIPFPGRATAGDAARRPTEHDPVEVEPPVDSIRMVEDALDRVQRGLDDLTDALSPIPFVRQDDDGPWAA